MSELSRIYISIILNISQGLSGVKGAKLSVASEKLVNYILRKNM